MPRSLSEKVYVRNNIFTNGGGGGASGNAPSPQKGAPPAAAQAKETID